MRVVPTAISDVKILEPKVLTDERGFFLETWNAKTFAGLGLEGGFVQDNHSRSAKGVLRGLHMQTRRPQGKLVRVTAGTVFDVCVDLRQHSQNHGQWVGVELSAANMRMLWIPAGFAHGFLSLTDGAEVVYKCTDFYDPGHEATLLWSDPALAIAWPLEGGATPILSAKDAAGVTLHALEPAR